MANTRLRAVRIMFIQKADCRVHYMRYARVRDISLQPSSGFSSKHRGSSAKLLLWPFVKVSKSTRIYGFRSHGFIYQGADGKCVIDNNG
jgi:hypothetical protein